MPAGVRLNVITLVRETLLRKPLEPGDILKAHERGQRIGKRCKASWVATGHQHGRRLTIQDERVLAKERPLHVIDVRDQCFERVANDEVRILDRW